MTVKYFIWLMLFVLVPSANAADLEIHFELPGLHVRDFALSADGQELYLTMESIAKDASQIIKVNKTDTGWSTPKIASFSGQFKDLEPFLHPNGIQLFFASNRNDEQTAATEQFDIWQVSRTSPQSAWGKPIKLNANINSSGGNEFYPSVASNGNLYFTATKKDGIGKEDIYVSRWVNGEYTEAVLLPETINSNTYEFNAYISPDENMLLFSSFGRKDGQGGGDLYASFRIDGVWQPAKNLGPEFNSKQLDYCPFYDAEQQMLYWTSSRSQLKSLSDQSRNYNEWFELFTSGENGFSKIYARKIQLSP